MSSVENRPLCLNTTSVENKSYTSNHVSSTPNLIINSSMLKSSCASSLLSPTPKTPNFSPVGNSSSNFLTSSSLEQTVASISENASEECTTRVGYLSPQGQQPDFAHELPITLLEAGWRKFWSKRENRPYFFNKITNQSSWELPQISPSCVSTSPCGYGLNSNNSHLVNGIGSSSSSGDALLKRRLSLSGAEDAAAAKQAKRSRPQLPPHMPGALWDLGASGETEALIMAPTTSLPYFPPHPEIELLRAQMLNLLRIEFVRLCQQRDTSLSLPAESFNRWLLECKITDRSTEPLFPANCAGEVSPCLFRELANAVPVSLHKVKYSHEARRQLHAYAEGAKKLITAHSASAESRKIIKWNCEDTFIWLRRQKLPPLDDCVERLAHLKRQCQPHIVEVMRESLQSLCSKLYQRSVEHATRVRERHLQLIKSATSTTSTSMAAATKTLDIERRLVPVDEYCLSLCSELCVLPAALAGPVDLVEEGEQVYVMYQQVRCYLQRSYLAKLHTLYEFHALDDPHKEKFVMRLWCLLRRYNSFFGSEPDEGTVNQGALPIPVFEALRRCFGVRMELFASPLNCYFRQFCSAFADTDGYFGSRGPFLDFYPRQGCYEANPPFCEDFLTACVDHMENLLRESTLPLSFIIFLPDFRDPPFEALIKLEASEFNRCQVSIPPLEHDYRHGMQHLRSTDQLAVRSFHATLVIFLQNADGHRRYAPTEERLGQMLLAFKSNSGSSSNCETIFNSGGVGGGLD